ncbi:PKD domain-containing protein [Sediminibacterium ginsengisoli]|uniref:PKD domain-containing protein n=1 Tax=Sediminibacterium ginsengisoli TaxID=413434 RepID=UPI0015915C4D|nr:PKD domain-containing protein [Sediminibacterium ginsengisoli]
MILFLGLSILPLDAHAQPAPHFSANITSGCAPLVVQFRDSSTGNPSSWKWDLGNGTTSTSRNPGVIYAQPGLYTVKLVVTNAAGSDSLVKTNYIEVYAKPEIDFVPSVTAGCAPLPVTFRFTGSPGSGTVAETTWDFGDGRISRDTQPRNVYTIPNTYGVTLTVKNSKGCAASLQKPALVNASGVKASFNYNFINTCEPPVTVSFTNTSASRDQPTYKWDFGDGGSSAQTSPLHQFESQGSYTVSLIAMTQAGCADSFRQVIPIGVLTPDFAIPVICINTPAVFISTSSPSPSSMEWDFGNGSVVNGDSAAVTFTSAGTYNIRLTAHFANCVRTVSKRINIENKPVASFVLPGDGSFCRAPVGAGFINKSQGASLYKWLFGDGSTSSSEHPDHIYTAEGSYAVTLIAYNVNQCTDTALQTNAIRIQQPVIDTITGIPFRGCLPATLNMTPLIRSAEPIVGYEWNFGDGTTSSDASPAHTYTTTGTYDVSLTITTRSGCKKTLTIPKAVMVDVLPVPAFSASPVDVCASVPIQFTDESTGNIQSWRWEFGNGGTSGLKNPTYYYNDTGYFNVTLTVINNGCRNNITRNRLIHIQAPVAKFSYTFNCNNDYRRVFINNSIDAGSSTWDFGDGQTSSERNPIHIYTQPGLYTVTLTVTNGTCTDVQKQEVRIIDARPAFIYSLDNAFCKNQSGIFVATQFESALVSAFTWFYGDGTASERKKEYETIEHTYQRAGSYQPFLVVENILGCRDTARISAPLQAYGPIAAFRNTAGSCLSDGLITFTDTSVSDKIHPVTKREWMYGDGFGDTFTVPGATHKYEKAGSFVVKLKVTDSYGCMDSVVKNASVIITNPKAEFNISDTLLCSKNNLKFTSASIGSPSFTYRWDFGDGGSSTAVNPVHFYNQEGTYAVRLKITDNYGCTDSVFKQNLVTIADPHASFTLADTFAVCPPLIINPENTSVNALNYTWTFNDGNISGEKNPVHYYTMGGEYTLELVAGGFGNCRDTARKKLVVKGPSGKFTYGDLNGCDTLTVRFKAVAANTSYVVWDMNDGNTFALEDSLFNYTYAQPGNYVPQVLLTDNASCQVTIKGKDTIRIASVKAGAASRITQLCDSTYLSLTDSSTVTNARINNYLWTSVTKGIRTGSNAVLTYTDTAMEQISLVVTTNGGCSDSTRFPVSIPLKRSPDIRTMHPATACANTAVSFFAADSLTHVITSWRWDFGDGSGAGTATATHLYNTAGNYKVTLTAIDNAGCADTVAKSLLLFEAPVTEAGRDTIICLGSSLTLKPSGAEQYNWRSSATLSCTNCSNPVATPGGPATYFVTGSNQYGCHSSDSIRVGLKFPVRVNVRGKDTICIGESTQLFASPAERYQWTPAIAISNSTIPNPVVRPLTTTTYTVRAGDSLNCFSDTKSITVKVYPIPVISIADSVKEVPAGNTVQLRTVNSSDINNWRWSPAIWLSCNNCPEPFISPKNNITYRVLVSNEGHCTAADEVKIIVTCSGSNVFIPNTFSPNGDGMNDVFYPRGKGLYKVRSFNIYNRAGQLVYSVREFDANDASKGWDGKSGGREAPADVYVYTIEIVCENNAVIASQGNISLLR